MLTIKILFGDRNYQRQVDLFSLPRQYKYNQLKYINVFDIFGMDIGQA